MKRYNLYPRSIYLRFVFSITFLLINIEFIWATYTDMHQLTPLLVQFNNNNKLFKKSNAKIVKNCTNEPRSLLSDDNSKNSALNFIHGIVFYTISTDTYWFAINAQITRCITVQKEISPIGRGCKISWERLDVSFHIRLRIPPMRCTIFERPP